MTVYDLDKTQEWLNRTQELRRKPAVRGGVLKDVRARNQALAGVGAVMVAVLALALLPWSGRPTETHSIPNAPVPQSARASSALEPAPALIASPSPKPAPPPAAVVPPIALPTGPSTPIPRAAPFAPIWLDQQRFLMATRTGGFIAPNRASGFPIGGLLTRW